MFCVVFVLFCVPFFVDFVLCCVVLCCVCAVLYFVVVLCLSCCCTGKALRVPERVPFRLTADLIDGMGLAGVEGVFR